MNLKSFIGNTLAVGYLALILVGLALIFHDKTHIVVDEGEASASILGLGKISGSSHVVLIYIGLGGIVVGLVGLGKFYNKLQQVTRFSRRAMDSFRRRPTKEGKRIAELKRLHREEEEG